MNHIYWSSKNQLCEHRILGINTQCYYTYLNSGLLKAPRKYVIHGLVPSSNWAPLWPHPSSMHLVATPAVSCCLLQRFKFHTQRLLLSGGLLTNVQVNIITTLHNIWHTSMYIHHISITIHFFFPYIFHSPGQAGCPPLATSATEIFHILKIIFS